MRTGVVREDMKKGLAGQIDVKGGGDKSERSRGDTLF